MPTVSVYDMTGKETGKMELSDAIFGIEPNKAVMHSAVVNYLANQRQGTQSTLTRAEVSGGGRKPWRQKGTGHARQGSTRAPQWTHGGIAFGPKPRSYRYAHPQENAPSGAEVRVFRQSGHRRHDRAGRPDFGGDQDQNRGCHAQSPGRGEKGS